MFDDGIVSAGKDLCNFVVRRRRAFIARIARGLKHQKVNGRAAAEGQLHAARRWAAAELAAPPSE
eukprot:1982004-Pyramimonas_sp.AAC.1